MTIKLAIQQDSHNSYPKGEVEIYEGERYVHIKVEDRDVAVLKSDFKWIGLFAERLETKGEKE